MLTSCQLKFSEQTQVKMESKYNNFHSRRCIWKYRLQNAIHFIHDISEGFDLGHRCSLQYRHMNDMVSHITENSTVIPSIKCISKKISKICVSCRLWGKITRYRWFSHKRTNVLVMTSSCRTDIKEPLVNSLRPNDAYTVSKLGRHWVTSSLKRKCLHFDEIFITGCTGSCQNDNFQCSQWLKFRQNDNIFVSVMACRLFGAASNHFLLQCWIIVNCSLRKSFSQNRIKILQFV